MNRAIYVPAIGEQFNSVWNRGLTYKGKSGQEFDMKFFTEKSHFQMPAALQSIYYAINGVGKNAVGTYRDMIKYPHDKILFTDSAGFQIASFAKKGEVCNISPMDSLRIQEANADVGFNLDVPPNLDGNPTYEQFSTALNISVKNFAMFEKERQNFKMSMLNVLHGETIPLMDLWYGKVKDFKFDGWAIGMKPPFDPMIQALGFMYLWEKGEFEKESCKNIHFFGTSGKHVVPTIAYAAYKLQKKIMVSYDSSSYNIGSIYRTYYSPFDYGPHLAFGEKFKLVNPKLQDLPCKCPVCLNIKDIQELNTTDIYAGTLISLHNLYQYWYYNDVITSLVPNRDLFMEYLQKVGISDKAIKSIEFIDYAMEKGVANAADKYKNDLIPQDLNKTRQASIWGF
jgi:queuine/archaeosine tRNA-ribosyltransferase